MSDARPVRDRILEAAAALFAEFGFHGTSIDRIAERASVAKGSVFYHFKSKDKLLVALVEEGFGLIRQAVGEPVPGSGSPSSRIETLMRKHLAMYVEYQHLARVIFHQARRGVSAEARALIDEAQERYRSFVKELIEAGIAAGELRTMDSDYGATLLMGLAGSAAEAWLRPEGPRQRMSLAAVADQLVQLALEGIRNQASPTLD